MKNKLISVFEYYSKPIKSGFYLSIIQIIGLVLPLFSYGYIIKKIGLESFGMIAYAQVLAAFPTIIIAYGFNIHGPKLISENIDSCVEQSRIFFEIVCAKFYLSIIIFIICTALAYAIAPNHQFFLLQCFSFWVFLYECLNPTWFFQGIQSLRKTTTYHAISKVLQLLLIYFFITNEKDYIYIPLIYGASALFGFVPLYFILKNNNLLIWHRLSSKQLFGIYKDSFSLFVMNISGAIYTYSPKFFVGLKLGYSDVAMYDFAEKIVSIAKMPIGIIAQAMYPMNCTNKNSELIKKQIIFLLLMSCIAYPVLLYLAKVVALYIGVSSLNNALGIVSFLLLTLPLTAISGFGALNFLIPFGQQRELSYASLSATGLYLFGSIFLYTNENTSLMWYAWLTVISELLFAIFVFYLIVQYDIKKSALQNPCNPHKR